MFRNINLIYILVLSSVFIVTSCDDDYKSMDDIKRDNEQKNIKEHQYKSQLQSINKFSVWWNQNIDNAPIPADYSYLKAFNQKDIDIIYGWYAREVMNSNSGGSDRFSSTEKKMAERFNVHYMVFEEVNSFMGINYLKYLDKITKEFFVAHKSTIVPDYYSPFQNTAYIGDYTFTGTFDLELCKDSVDLESQLSEHIDYLKSSLPTVISGFKIFDVRYNCEKTGTSGSFDIGYIWKRQGDVLLKKKSSSGLRGGHRTPKENPYWHERSWNNKNELPNSPDLLITTLEKL